jgi:hypothetical protein
MTWIQICFYSNELFQLLSLCVHLKYFFLVMKSWRIRLAFLAFVLLLLPLAFVERAMLRIERLSRSMQGRNSDIGR